MKSLLKIILILTIGACSSVRTFSDYDTEAKFEDYTTFRIGSEKDQLPDDPAINELNGQRVKNAIIREMEERGYVLSDQSDLVVNIYVKVEKRTKQVTTQDGPYFPYRAWYWYYGYWGYYYNYWGPGWGYRNTELIEYKEGTLVVDLVDTKTRKLVWHGVAIGNPDRVRTKAEQRINRAIDKLFRKFPFTAGSSSNETIRN